MSPPSPTHDGEAPSEPAAPEPDDKDWTWTLERVCPDCGYDASAVERPAIPARVREAARRVGAALGRPDAADRPTPTTWSALEYACHVRDVCRVFAERVTLMRHDDEPRFANWDQDATALEERYWAQDPTVVAVELGEASELAATAFGAVGAADDPAWERRGLRSNGSEFTIDSLGRYFLHDLDHHVVDVGD